MPQTVFGAQAVVSSLNRAFNDASPANAIFQNQVAAAGTTDNSQFAFANQFAASFNGLSDAAFATKVLTNMGVLPSTNTAVQELATVLADLLEVTGLQDRGIVVLQLAKILSNLETAPVNLPELAVYSTAAVAWNQEIAASFLYSNNANSSGAETASELGLGRDNLVGTVGADVFTAPIINNSNTLQSADKIDGGAGTDRLQADVGNAQAFAITPETTGVEQVAIRAQAVPRDATNGNNTSSNWFENIVQIDAQRMSGVTQWESNNSRADVVIEDVRILDTQKTKDITIAMVETDPGNVDFAVYFDQLSLRNTSSGQTSLNIRLMDTGAAHTSAGATPLLNNPYDQFKIGVNGQLVTIDMDKTKVAAADTYEAFLAVFNEALVPFNLVAKLEGTFTIIDPISGLQVTGQQIILGGPAGVMITEMAGSGWFNTAGVSVPSTSNIYTTYGVNASSTVELVTSKVILDDVGRGSTGGDLVIGGQSTGDTSTSRGVERFEIEVRDNSKLQTINSTNNALREVTIVNGNTSDNVQDAYTDTVLNEGNLTVNGDAAQALAAGWQSGGNNQLPGVENNSPVGVHHGAGTAGFVDVRLIDASAFKGKLAFTADITADSIAKYINLVDTNGNPVADVAGAGNVNFDVRGANFAYTGGNDNDTMVVTIDGDVAASRSKVVSGQSDFTFDVAGGAGNDAITVSVVAPRAPNGSTNWYNNQDLNNNIAINGGEGNDTIRTPGAGDVRIDAGAGNDVLYTDNTGVQANATDAAMAVNVAGGKAQWVLNTTDQTAALVPAARNINDLRSDTNESYNLYKGTVTVNFKGLPSKTIVIESTGYKTTDLQINQAIKNAINTDVVLNKLLVAQDGPANSLVINSLIDGVMSPADLDVIVAAPAVNTLNSTEITEAGKVYLAAGTAATDANVLAAMTAALATFATNGDYVDQMANDGALDIVGAASVTASDNLITLGTGDDIVVLGTTVGADTANSSNETLVFAPGFGNDVVVNFDTAGNGVDAFDFTALNGTTLTAGYTTDKSITIQAASTLATSSTVTEKAAIEALFNTTNNTVAQNHVFLSVSTHNVASVYTVVDPVGAANTVATLEGKIDLGTANWNTVSFASSSAANYHLVNGPALNTLPPVPPAPVWTAPASVNEGATATFVLNNVAAGTTEVAYTLSGIHAEDVAGGLLTGTAAVVNGTATINVALLADASINEGAETLTIDVAGLTASTIVNDTSVSAGTVDSLVAAAAAANEGTTATFTLTTTGMVDGTTVPYTLTGIEAADVVGGALAGVATVTGNSATISVALAADVLLEGAQTLTVAAAGFTANTIVNDTSVPGTPLVVGTTAPVAATAAADTFTFEVAAAQASAPDTQITINGFDVAADTLQINAAVALPAMTTLAGLDADDATGNADGIIVQTNPIAPGYVLLNFGADADGNLVTITLAGVTDPALVNISVI